MKSFHIEGQLSSKTSKYTILKYSIYWQLSMFMHNPKIYLWKNWSYYWNWLPQ